LIWSTENYLMMNTDRKPSHYVVFYNFVLLLSSCIQKYSTAPYSLIFSAYVPPSVWKTKFDTPTKQIGLQFWIS
jgi:hypothetical protein